MSRVCARLLRIGCSGRISVRLMGCVGLGWRGVVRQNRRGHAGRARCRGGGLCQSCGGVGCQKTDQSKMHYGAGGDVRAGSGRYFWHGAAGACPVLIGTHNCLSSGCGGTPGHQGRAAAVSLARVLKKRQDSYLVIKQKR